MYLQGFHKVKPGKSTKSFHHEATGDNLDWDHFAGVMDIKVIKLERMMK